MKNQNTLYFTEGWMVGKKTYKKKVN